jgi:hypothetical protein
LKPSINPIAVARYRERHRVARAKSDHADAMALANIILRTDAEMHRPLRGSARRPAAHGPARRSPCRLPPWPARPRCSTRFLPDGKRLVITTNTAMIWDISDPENPREVGRTRIDEDVAPVVGALAITP